MTTSDELGKWFAEIEQKDYGTRFFKADLHFHTPSSSDARGPNKYGFNPYGMFYLSDSADPKREEYRVLKDLKVVQGVELNILDVLDSQTLNDLRKKVSGAARVLDGIQELMSIKNRYVKDLKKVQTKGADLEVLNKRVEMLNKTYGNASRSAIRAVVEDMQAFEKLKGPVKGLGSLEGRVATYADILKNNELLKKKFGDDSREYVENIYRGIKSIQNPQVANLPGVETESLESFENEIFRDVYSLHDENEIRERIRKGLPLAKNQSENIQRYEEAVRFLRDLDQYFENKYPEDIALLRNLGSDDMKAIDGLSPEDTMEKVTSIKGSERAEEIISDFESTLSDINVFIDFRTLKNPKDFKLSETLLGWLTKREDKQYDFVTDFGLSVALNPPGYPQTLRDYQYQILLYARVKAAQIVCGFLEKGLSLVAITDHNGMGTIWGDEQSKGMMAAAADEQVEVKNDPASKKPAKRRKALGDDEQVKGKMDLAAPTWYELIDDAAQKANETWGTRLVILPGVEISTTGVHILAIFKPQTPRRKVHLMVCDLVEEVGISPDDWCNNQAVGNMSPYDTIELISKRGGIAIPAHVDGDDKALLELYKLEIGALENVVGNKNLRAVEVINPDRFREGETKNRLDKVRSERDLSSLAYFQGSDSHDIENIAKRATILKMTKPSFEGLKTAIKMPASRVQFSSDRKDWDGLYLRGMVFDHPDLGMHFLRFNRNLNCISGKVGVGKSTLHDLMRAAVKPDRPYPQGRQAGSSMQGFTALFVEKMSENNETAPKTAAFKQYAFYRKAEPSPDPIKFYWLSPEGTTATESKMEEAINGSLQPRFYDAEQIQGIIDDEDKLLKFLAETFGIQAHDPANQEAATAIKNFNTLFLLPRFFSEEAKGQLLELTVDNGKYTLRMNMQWRVGRPVMKEFSRLSKSQRKTALMCMMLRKEEYGPVIIDDPEQEFDNEDMTKYLVPLIQEYKDKRQILLFTNHPILAVNTDPDNYFLLHLQDAREEVELVIDSGFAIDAPKADKDLLIKVLEGDLGAFHKRASRYE